MDGGGTTLIVGGTGTLGGRVVSALLERGKQVRALVRPSSDASALEASGVEIARGDLMDPESLRTALSGVDAVVTSAAGYTRHSKGDTPDIDTVGNRNLVDAASAVGVRRFVLTSILTCDQTPGVPHFWHKKLVEDRLEELGVPFVSLRPGAFLDQITQFGGDPFAKRRLTWIGSATTRLTFVLVSDLAGHLADAVDVPGVDGERIDIGWDRPVSMQDIAQITGDQLGERIRIRTIPGGLISGVATVLGPVNPMLKDIAAMLKWFETGNYVADTSRQGEVFGRVPTAEDAIASFVRSLGHDVAA